MIRIGLILMVALTVMACKSKKGGANSSSETVNEQVILDQGFNAPKDNAAFEVLEANIEGDLLKLKVQYSGGCEAHTFKAYFNGIYMKSMPPKASVFVVHQNNGDNCRELKTEDLVFDLNNVKYPNKEGDYTVMVGINNYEGYLTYKY